MKVHKEGTGLLLTLFTILFIVNVVLYYTVQSGLLFYAVSLTSAIFFLLILNFFRSPYRRFPFDPEGFVIAPADGTIVAIEETVEKEIFREKRLQVSIFMSVFNVHANWFSCQWNCQICSPSEWTFHGCLSAEKQYGE